MNTKAVLFDLEGTVIATEKAWDDIEREFLGRHGIAYERDAVKHLMMGKKLREGVAVLQEKLGLRGDIDDLTEERRLIAKKHLSRDVGFEPGARTFVEKAAQRFPVAVATGMERMFFNLVDKALPISELFGGHVYTYEDCTCASKPSPDIFLYAASQLGVEPGRCAAIEDAPHGIAAIKNAGMYAIGITTSMPRERLAGADRIVESFSEISLDDLP